jgi:hypothetical protein
MMTFSEIVHKTLSRGVTYRAFPGGRRCMVHRWRKDQMRGVERDLLDEVSDNVTRGNSLLQKLKRP